MGRLGVDEEFSAGTELGAEGVDDWLDGGAGLEMEGEAGQVQVAGDFLVDVAVEEKKAGLGGVS